ncbi:hypothetical protein VUR80DRAFT_4210 [Thermomyces stellatus]
MPAIYLLSWCHLPPRIDHARASKGGLRASSTKLSPSLPAASARWLTRAIASHTARPPHGPLRRAHGPSLPISGAAEPHPKASHSHGRVRDSKSSKSPLQRRAAHACRAWRQEKLILCSAPRSLNKPGPAPNLPLEADARDAAMTRALLFCGTFRC